MADERVGDLRHEQEWIELPGRREITTSRTLVRTAHDGWVDIHEVVAVYDRCRDVTVPPVGPDDDEGGTS